MLLIAPVEALRQRVYYCFFGQKLSKIHAVSGHLAAVRDWYSRCFLTFLKALRIRLRGIRVQSEGIGEQNSGLGQTNSAGGSCLEFGCSW